MKQQLFVALLSISCLLVACSKNKPDNQQPEQPGGQVKLPHGTPVGEIATAQIGPAGGTLTGKDGTMKITVPAGAVTEPVTFSVQEVNSVLENGARSYRLLPDNVAFKKPVTLTYHYAGLEIGHTNPDFLFLAFQDKEGRFFSANTTTGNRQQQTLTVSTTHFSDWTFFAEYEFFFLDDHQLVSGELHLGEGESTRIVLQSRKLDKKEDVSELPEVTGDPVVDAATWDYAPKKGTMIKIAGYLPGVTYTAPAKVTATERVYINVTINGNLGRDNLGNPVQQMQFRLPIVLDPDGYFILTENGADMSGTSFSATYIKGRGSEITASFFNGYTIVCYTYYGTTGDFEYNEHFTPGKASLALAELGGSEHGASYITYYPKDCDKGNEMAYSPGSFVLKKVGEKKGEYFEGEFTATFYFFSWCQRSNKKTLSGKFRIRATE